MDLTLELRAGGRRGPAPCLLRESLRGLGKSRPRPPDTIGARGPVEPAASPSQPEHGADTGMPAFLSAPWKPQKTPFQILVQTSLWCPYVAFCSGHGSGRPHLGEGLVVDPW